MAFCVCHLPQSKLFLRTHDKEGFAGSSVALFDQIVHNIRTSGDREEYDRIGARELRSSAASLNRKLRSERRPGGISAKAY